MVARSATGSTGWELPLTELNRNLTTPLMSTGNGTTDSALNFITEQLKLIGSSVELGFNKMESLVTDLNQFGEQLNRTITDMELRIQKEVMADQLGSTTTTAGNKIDGLYQRTEELKGTADTQNAMFQSIRDKMDLVDRLGRGLRTVREAQVTQEGNAAAATPIGGSPTGRVHSILEYKSITEIKRIGNNKLEWKEWIYQLKNCLRPILGQNGDWERWINVAETHYTQSGSLKEIGEGLTVPLMDDQYENVGNQLKTLMINKLEPGSEPALIMRRFENGD